jgi:hypothetical protein
MYWANGMIGTTILTGFHPSRHSSAFRHKTKTYHEQLLNLLLVYRENILSRLLNTDYACEKTLAVSILTW